MFIFYILYILYILYFIFVSAMFDILLQKQGGEHSNSPRIYICFRQRSIDKINGEFQSANKTVLCPSDYAPKYFPEIYLGLQLQIWLYFLLACKKNRTKGHQMKSLFYAIPFRLLLLLWKKKFCSKHVAFQRQSLFGLLIS